MQTFRLGQSYKDTTNQQSIPSLLWNLDLLSVQASLVGPIEIKGSNVKISFNILLRSCSLEMLLKAVQIKVKIQWLIVVIDDMIRAQDEVEIYV